MRSGDWIQTRTVAALIMLLAAIASSSILMAAPAEANGQQLPDSQVSTTTTDGLQGGLACARCHQRVSGDFSRNPHATHAGICASCHGPGDAHIQSGGDKAKMIHLAQADAKQVDDTCLKCHAGTHLIYERSAHGRGNVSCIGCHSIHAARESEHLLRVAQPDLCFQCHQEEKAQFSAPLRHKVVEGVVLCTDCHEPHGSYGERAQRSQAQKDEGVVCTKCHTAQAGPFQYEHGIIRTEGCSACHSPHGGPNPKMLNRTRINTICLLCHFPPQISSTGESLVKAHSPADKGQVCTECHTDIHGSNVSALFLKNK